MKIIKYYVNVKNERFCFGFILNSADVSDQNGYLVEVEYRYFYRYVIGARLIIVLKTFIFD